MGKMSNTNWTWEKSFPENGWIYNSSKHFTFSAITWRYSIDIELNKVIFFIVDNDFSIQYKSVPKSKPHCIEEILRNLKEKLKKR